MGEVIKFNFGKDDISYRDTIPLYFVEKEMIKRIKESKLLTIIPLDEPQIKLAHQFGGSTSDIVFFVEPDSGEKVIFFNSELRPNF